MNDDGTLLKVLICGRPNVGKSTLFNRLVGKRLAIVDDTPGVTRDVREGEGKIADLTFTVMDTAGLESATTGLESRMSQRTEAAIKEADVALFLIDARAGVTPLDEHFASLLRRSKTPVYLVANKCEGRAGAGGLGEAYALGLGDPIPVSAEHGEGMGELYDILKPLVDAQAEAVADHYAAMANEDDLAGLIDDGDPEKKPDGPLQLAIVGRPNVGKSTLVNCLLGEDRMLTGPEAGITRDSISSRWKYGDRDIRLVDTAGLRRKARINQKVETLSASDTLRSINFAQVVALVIDANEGLEKQDLTIARNVIDEGRALILVINKWDAVEDRAKALAGVEDRLMTSLPQVRGIPVVTLSAKTGKGVDGLMKAALGIFDIWNAHISTSRLNRWLEAMLESHPPPLVGGRHIKIRYMTQPKSRPPTFAVFANRADKLPESYVRYLSNGIRETFGLDGIPIRILMRKGKNPYAS